MHSRTSWENGTIVPKFQKFEKIKIVWVATIKEYLEKIRIFRTATGTIWTKQIFFVPQNELSLQDKVSKCRKTIKI